MSAARWDPSSPAFQHDPYPLYERLQREDPVHRADGVWVVTRHADVAALLRDPRCLATKFPADRLLRVAASEAGAREVLQDLTREPPLQPNPPCHSPTRLAVNRIFGSRTVERWRPLVQQIAAALLDDVPAGSDVDLVAQLARPLPMRVMSHLLVVDCERLWRWSDRLSALADHGERGLVAAAQAAVELRAHLVARIAAQRTAPADDLIGALVELGVADALDVDELCQAVATMLAAGNETTQDLIGNGLHALLHHPAALDELRAAPARVPAAIEEMLRFDAPVQLVTRVCRATGCGDASDGARSSI